MRATESDIESIAHLVWILRTDWEAWLIRSVLQSHAHKVEMSDLAIAALRYAQDPSNVDPRGIGWRGKHWRDLDTQPDRVANARIRCYVCGKPEDRCITERPGPDDHQFEAARLEDLPIARNRR